MKAVREFCASYRCFHPSCCTVQGRATNPALKASEAEAMFRDHCVHLAATAEKGDLLIDEQYEILPLFKRETGKTSNYLLLCMCFSRCLSGRPAVPLFPQLRNCRCDQRTKALAPFCAVHSQRLGSNRHKNGQCRGGAGRTPMCCSVCT